MKSQNKFAVFSDPWGLPRLIRALGRDRIACVVRAEIRPEQEAEMAQLVNEAGLPLIVQPANKAEAANTFLPKLAGYGAGTLLCYSYAAIIGSNARSLFHGKAFNVHEAFLPRYRGANPIQWSIINRETSIGVTLHLMTDEVDAGHIIDQVETHMHISETWWDIHCRLGVLAEDLIARNANSLANGEFELIPQDGSQVISCRRRKPEDGEIDWDAPLLDIYNLIRALVLPLPGAFTAPFETESGEPLRFLKRSGLTELFMLKCVREGKERSFKTDGAFISNEDDNVCIFPDVEGIGREEGKDAVILRLKCRQQVSEDVEVSISIDCEKWPVLKMEIASGVLTDTMEQAINDFCKSQLYAKEIYKI